MPNPTLLDRTTHNARKRAFFDEEVYYRESIFDCHELWPRDPIHKLARLTTVILKPEAIAARMVETCLGFFQQHGFQVVAADALQVDRLMIRELWRYRFNIATRDRLTVMDLLMGASPSLFIVLEDARQNGGEAASSRLKELKGPSAPHTRAPHQLRYSLGLRSHLINYLHAPDETADVIRELGILFDAPRRRRVLALSAAGEERSADALRIAADLYRAHPPHDLSYEASLQRLAAVARTAAASPSGSQALTCTERIVSNESRDWRTLFRALDATGRDVGLWDRIMVMAALVEMSLPDRQPLL